MSTAKAMTTEDRQARYLKQNGHSVLTDRQAHRIKKTALRLQHGRHRKHVARPGGERAVKGRQRMYADWMRESYSRWLRRARRQDRRAKLGRYTLGRG